MARKLVIPPPSVGVKALRAAVEQHRHKSELDLRIDCRLVTPLFGGGHTAGVNDLVSPISPKGIRGQLRFWWRVVMGTGLAKVTGLSSIDLMALRETEIFGSADLPSPFDLIIAAPRTASTQKRSFSQDRPYAFGRTGAEAYALFPAIQGQKQDLLKEGLAFQLMIRWCGEADFARRRKVEAARRYQHNQRRPGERHGEWPEPWNELREIRQHVDAALWAWLNFGGTGARTRRGLGAVATDDTRFFLVAAEGRLRHVVPNMTIFRGSSTSGDDAQMIAWRESLKVYRDFRQGCRGGIHPKTFRNGKTHSVPGRSFWPEPDSLREITGCALRPSRAGGASAVAPEIDAHDHSRPIVAPGTVPGFPRALLGLPIIFHFSDGPGKGNPPDRLKDPGDAQLVPFVMNAHGQRAEGQRMSSPVITRPVRIEGGWCPAVIILRPPYLDGLEAYLTVSGVNVTGDTGPKDRRIPENQIVNPKWTAFTDPRWPMSGEQDALSALASYLKTKGFETFPRTT